MSTISSVTTPASAATANSGPGDNGSTAAGGVDFNDVLNQLYAVEDECNKAIGELTQKVEQLAKNSDGPAGVASTQTTTQDASTAPAASTTDPVSATEPTTTSSLNLQQSLADSDSSTATLASFMKAMQSYTKAQVLPDLNASLLFATNS